MIADGRPFTVEQCGHVSLAMKRWWRDRRPSPREIQVGDIVAQTGGTIRPLRVIERKGASVRCEWRHNGKRCTDWFCVSGLRLEGMPT